MKKFAALCIIAFFIAGCAKPNQPKPPYSQIPALQTPQTPGAQKVNSIRTQAIQDTAMSVGAQGGLAWRSAQINRNLTREQDDLNRIFDFNSLILSKNVLPPVLAEGDTTLNIADPTALRLADKVYQLVQAPRFVTVPPTWRDYLWMNYQKPDVPNNTLLPQNEAERAMWNQYVQTGWQAGVSQANEIFSVNLGRLKRDYAGMILYRKLLAQNMVTAPFVAKVDLGVTGDAKSIRINDQVLRITATSQLNPNAKTWKPVMRPGEAGGEDTDADEANPQ